MPSKSQVVVRLVMFELLVLGKKKTVMYPERRSMFWGFFGHPVLGIFFKSVLEIYHFNDYVIG